MIIVTNIIVLFLFFFNCNFYMMRINWFILIWLEKIERNFCRIWFVFVSNYIDMGLDHRCNEIKSIVSRYFLDALNLSNRHLSVSISRLLLLPVPSLNIFYPVSSPCLPFDVPSLLFELNHFERWYEIKSHRKNIVRSFLLPCPFAFLFPAHSF